MPHQNRELLALHQMPTPPAHSALYPTPSQPTNLHQQAQVNPHLMQLLWQGLNSVWQQHTIDDQEHSYPDTIQMLFWQQCSIGWDQLFHGRITTSWAFYIDHHMPTKTNGTIFYSKVINLIWTYILSSWHQRNTALHNPNPMDDFRWQALETQVAQIFQQIQEDPTLHQHAPRLTLEQIMQQPIRYIRRFVTTSNSQMRDCIRAACKCTQLNIRDIRSYFTSSVWSYPHIITTSTAFSCQCPIVLSVSL